MSAATLAALAAPPIVDGLLAALIGAGAVTVLSAAPWFSRKAISERLAPYLPVSNTRQRRPGREIGLRETVEPILDSLGHRLSAALGVVTDLETRLRRAGRQPDTYQFRLRELMLAFGGFGSAVFVWAVIEPPRLMTICLVVGLPALALLWSEQSLARSIQSRQERLVAELPVVIEQLGMLIAAGYSLTSSISHVSTRGNGVVAEDLRAVTAEIRRGVKPAEAFQAWADLSGVAAVDRVVAVLALNSEASDLGALISTEARSIRSEAHRDMVEAIERRAQLVWIPVTVATLVPGLIFLAVPFYSAMSKITGG